MKFNFWQVLGVILIVAALAFLVYEKTGVRPATPTEPAAPPAQFPSPATQPSMPVKSMPVTSMPIPTH